jgi:4-hydroxy-tetrahydrodipicolinate reductase
MIKIAVIGAAGRMGQTLIRLIAAAEDMQLSGAAAETGDRLIGADAGLSANAPSLGITISDDLDTALAEAQVAVDFTLPTATDANIQACLEHGIALVMGTTGLSEAQQSMLAEAGQRIGVVYGRNMSVGVNLLTELVRQASAALGPGYDVEVIEAHHRDKLDAPSGTALQLGEAVAAERGTTLDESAIFDRRGQDGPRRDGGIGFASIRAGSIVGDHAVMFTTAEEIIELKHRALDRQVFARGALRAARWLVGQPHGFYSMNDVLGLTGR